MSDYTPEWANTAKPGFWWITYGKPIGAGHKPVGPFNTINELAQATHLTSNLGAGGYVVGIELAANIKCSDCESNFHGADLTDVCPSCGSDGPHIDRGMDSRTVIPVHSFNPDDLVQPWYVIRNVDDEYLGNPLPTKDTIGVWVDDLDEAATFEAQTDTVPVMTHLFKDGWDPHQINIVEITPTLRLNDYVLHAEGWDSYEQGVPTVVPPGDVFLLHEKFFEDDRRSFTLYPSGEAAHAGANLPENHAWSTVAIIDLRTGEEWKPPVMVPEKGLLQHMLDNDPLDVIDLFTIWYDNADLTGLSGEESGSLFDAVELMQRIIENRK